MKKLGILILTMVVFYSCQTQEPQNYVSIEGKFEYNKDSFLYITGFGVRKKIAVNKDGTFKDSLKVVEPNLYTISTPNTGRAPIYLKNGYSLNFSGNSSNFFYSFKFKGDDEGSDTNNFLVNRYNFSRSAGNGRELVKLEKDLFLQKIQDFHKGMDSITGLFKNANADLIKKSDEQNTNFTSNLEANYDKFHESILRQEQIEAKLAKGNPAPEFKDYENFRGGKMSLKDFKGNYVYIDVWATWCKPCIAQIPFLKKLEKEFEGKNISFVSISTDNDRRSGGDWDRARQKWKNMVKNKDLSGTQLWAGKDELRLSQEYNIQGIPRFILIDPEGKIVNKNEMRPSNPGISSYLTKLGVK